MKNTILLALVCVLSIASGCSLKYKSNTPTPSSNSLVAENTYTNPSLVTIGGFVAFTGGVIVGSPAVAVGALIVMIAGAGSSMYTHNSKPTGTPK